jgi:mxaA protein
LPSASKRRWLAIAPTLLAAAASAAEHEAVVEAVRRYGYVIGDTIELHARVAVPPLYALDVEKLPKPGRVNAFLELRSIEPLDARLQRHAEGGNGTPLALRFLVVNSGTQVRSVQTPALALTYRRADAPDFAVRIPQVEFTVSPLTPEYVAGTTGLKELQGDVPPPRLPTRGAMTRLLVYALLALALFGYVAWRRGWVPRRLLARRPFARAAKDLRGMRENATTRLPEARARRLHRAFDESAGFTVASHRLEEFFAAQPWSAALEAEIRDFYSRSALFFYADEVSALPPQGDVVRLARALAACEPRTGRA